MENKIFISQSTGTIYWLHYGNLMFAPLPLYDTEVDFQYDGGEVDWNVVKAEDGQRGVDALKKIEAKLK